MDIKYTERLIKRLAKDNALCLEWNDGKAKVSIIGYGCWNWRDDLIRTFGKSFVLELDRIATEILNDGDNTNQPIRRRH